MAGFTREELEAAFVHYWRCGAVAEDWDAWADCFTDDVVYVEHVLGTMHGREAVRAWIKPIMAQYGEIYSAYEWHMVDPATGRICVYIQNRRDHPERAGHHRLPRHHDPPVRRQRPLLGEEDFWAIPQAQQATEAYAAACKAHDPEHAKKMTRLEWGNGPAWTRGGRSFAERPPAPSR